MATPHPFGWPPSAPTTADLQPLEPRWRAKLLADYQDELNLYLHSVLWPLLRGVGQELGVGHPPLVESRSVGPKPEHRAASQDEKDAREAKSGCQESLPCVNPPEDSCYNAANVAQEGRGTLEADAARAIKECCGRPFARTEERDRQSRESAAETQAGQAEKKRLVQTTHVGASDHPARAVSQPFQQERNRQIIRDAFLAERYRNHIWRIVLRVASPPAPDFLLCFERLPIECESSDKLAVNTPHLFEWASDEASRNERAVFVYNVECVCDPEIVTVPSLVWLQGIDERFTGGTEQFFLSLARFESVVIGGVSADEELGLAGIYSRVMLSCNSEREMIECRADVMHRIPDHRVDVVRQFDLASSVYDYIRTIRVILDAKQVVFPVRFGGDQVSKSPFEIRDVLVGPIDF